jgi:hypothetical protein
MSICGIDSALRVMEGIINGHARYHLKSIPHAGRRGFGLNGWSPLGRMLSAVLVSNGNFTVECVTVSENTQSQMH